MDDLHPLTRIAEEYRRNKSACYVSTCFHQVNWSQWMGLTTITDENKSPGAFVERNYGAGCSQRGNSHICTCNAGKVARKWANGPLVVNPDCKRAFITLARGRRGAKRRDNTMRAGDAPLQIHFSTKTTTSTRFTIPHVYVKRDLFSACNYERSPHLAINTVLRS